MNSHKVIKRPIVSEKSFALAQGDNQYCFKVAKSANKIEVAKAIEDIFDVEVTNVRTLINRPRKVRFGKNRKEGRKGAWKKAVVTLKEGDKIELFDAA